MTQPTHIEEQRKEKIYEILNKMYEDKSYIDCAYEDFQSLIRTTLTQLVERDLEWAESKKRKNTIQNSTGNENKIYLTQNDEAYNQALTDFINHKREEV